MTDYAIFHLDVNGTVTKTLGKFGDGFTLNASSLHSSYEEGEVYYHALENPWLSSNIYRDVDDFDGTYEECGNCTSSEEDEFTEERDLDPLKGYFIVMHIYNDRSIRPRNLPHFNHKVINGVLKELFPQSMYYGNAAIVKTDLRDDSVENVEEEWSEISDYIRQANWIIDMEGHIRHAREYKILGRKVKLIDLLKHCPSVVDLVDDKCDSRDIYDYFSRELHLRDIKSQQYDIYGNIDDMYLGRRLDIEIIRKLRDPDFLERELEIWLKKLTGKGDYKILTIYSWLN